MTGNNVGGKMGEAMKELTYSKFSIALSTQKYQVLIDDSNNDNNNGSNNISGETNTRLPIVIFDASFSLMSIFVIANFCLAYMVVDGNIPMVI